MSRVASRFFSSQLFFWIVLAGLSLWYLLPLNQSLRFGLDLVGGTYITLETQVSKAIEAELLSLEQAIPAQLNGENVAEPISSQVKDDTLILTFADEQIAARAKRVLDGYDPEGSIQRAFHTGIKRPLRVAQKDQQLSLSLTDAATERLQQEAVERNIEVLRTRLNPLGVGEITIAAAGQKDIVVELPNVADPQQARQMIGRSASLEFKLVDQAAGSREALLYDYDGELPPNKEILPSKDRDFEGNPQEFYLVSRLAPVTGKDLRMAKPDLNPMQQVVVAFGLSPDGGKRFAELTKNNVGRRLAIVLDDVVISAPSINQKISDSGVITGNFTADSARELSLLLKSGAFVAPVTFEEERQIGPSLGAESIRQGFVACLIGLGLLFLFSLLVYKIAGLFAFIALLFNLLFILLGLSWLGATLTLPGIFGMVLTSGMAIDASVLIYERIKEELAAGSGLRQAVENGFSDAMVVILDSNITTFIVGVVLYKFGTGPIQGFAVTMMLGIISTLLTGLFFLKSIFMAAIDLVGVKKIYI